MSDTAPLISKIESQFARANPLPEFRVGDTVRVQVKIREGEKERLQAFEGVCIARHRGGSRASFTVRKISYGVGVERVFAECSPNVSEVKVLSQGKVRQARLYYLRDLTGKAARIKERAWEQPAEGEEKKKGKKRGAHRKSATEASAAGLVDRKRKKRDKKAATKAKVATKAKIQVEQADAE